MGSSLKIHGIHVRLTESQYKQLTKESQIMDKSKAEMLREGYFKGKKITILFDMATANNMYKEMNKIGVNINQITKRINSGLSVGLYEDLLKEIKNEFQKIVRILINNGDYKESFI